MDKFKNKFLQHNFSKDAFLRDNLNIVTKEDLELALAQVDRDRNKLKKCILIALGAISAILITKIVIDFLSKDDDYDFEFEDDDDFFFDDDDEDYEDGFASDEDFE